MSDNVKKALESTDVSVIKKAFGMEEGQVTKYVDRIHAILKSYDENGSYNCESIYKVELREAVAGLRESLKELKGWFRGFIFSCSRWLRTPMQRKAELKRR